MMLRKRSCSTFDWEALYILKFDMLRYSFRGFSVGMFIAYVNDIDEQFRMIKRISTL